MEQNTGEDASRPVLLEQKRLSSANHPGRKEELTGVSGIRNRKPSSVSARAIYQDALQTMKERLEDLHETDGSGPPILKEQARELYEKASKALAELRKAAEDLNTAVSGEGASAEVQDVEQQVVAFQSQLLLLKEQIKTGDRKSVV